MSSIVAYSGQTRREGVYLPTYVLYIEEGEAFEMTYVPIVTSSTSAPFAVGIGMMNTPYTPHHGAWNVPGDTNLITLYGITVSSTYDPTKDWKKQKPVIIIDCKNANKPDGYTLTIEEVVVKVTECSELNFKGKEVKVINLKKIK